MDRASESENRFTGWTDVDLTKKGRIEAREAGRLLKENQFKFDLGVYIIS